MKNGEGAASRGVAKSRNNLNAVNQRNHPGNLLPWINDFAKLQRLIGEKAGVKKQRPPRPATSITLLSFRPFECEANRILARFDVNLQPRAI